ncbi:MAG TPA: hypothetical protein PLA50_13475, partial [Bacteroidia bacterium]|nr:hypothetical protein [Bacteroidia bacterium]
GYRAFRAENDGDESLFVLVGPEHHRMRYLSEISHLEGAVFLSIEEFLRLLSSMGAALSLDSVANDLRDFFLPVPIAKGQLQRELDEARSLTNEERSTLSVRRLTVQVRDILADRYSSQIACGPVVWGRLKKPDPWVGFLVRSLGGGLAVVNIGFWLRKDLETGVPLFVQISDDGLASALILRGYGLVPAKYTKWAKFEWIPRLDFPDISVDGIFELTTNFFEDMAREISDRDEPKVPEIE